ncbi:MAG TPA: ribonuclease III [Syntrophales bacterium]|nr:ribonuclease III [Syntrophales bacterium]HOL58708.1 ribonuclease III [Syntrophales bacterium]HPO35004.1 ribonuclease III [Syntrophales bacterium]
MNDARREALSAVEEALGYAFENIKLLDQALTHRSFSGGKGGDPRVDNERLEFLGDAALNLIISDLLTRMFPEDSEGLLSRKRAACVNELALARLATHFNLGHALLLGKGEETTGGRTKTSLLANTMEAVIAAIYLDGGYQAAYDFVARCFQPALEGQRDDLLFEDYKSSIQEWCQARFRCTPKYLTVSESGPDHDRTYVVHLKIQDKFVSEGQGKSRKEAEKDAARKALHILDELF